MQEQSLELEKWVPDLSTNNVFEEKGVEETDEQKYLKFKMKIKRQVEEAAIVSASEDSASNDELNSENTPSMDINREEDLKLFKKSQKA